VVGRTLGPYKLLGNKLKGGSGKAMTGQQLWEAEGDGDAAKVSTLLSRQGAQSFINYQDAQGATPLYATALNGHASVTKHLLAARCNVDLQRRFTPLHAEASRQHAAVAKQLIAARCCVDPQDKIGCTILQFFRARLSLWLVSGRSRTHHFS
jgi:hypothetical protein